MEVQSEPRQMAGIPTHISLGERVGDLLWSVLHVVFLF